MSALPLSRTSLKVILDNFNTYKKNERWLKRAIKT